jgi:hypothetical protein
MLERRLFISGLACGQRVGRIETGKKFFYSITFICPNALKF